VTWLGLGINLALAGAKILAGLLFASQAILADGLHSLTDLATDLAMLIALPLGDQPADPKHPYGHRRIFTLVSLFIGLMLLAAAAVIGYQAIRSFQNPSEHIRGPLPLILAAMTIPLKELLFRLTRRVGRAENNPALLANAWHHRSDAFTSLAAGLGIAGAMFLGPGWAILDGLTAMVLVAFLFVAAGRMILAAGGELIDSAPAPDHIAWLEGIVHGTAEVHGYHALRARNIGGRVEMDLHILVDPEISVRQGHDIARQVRQRICQADASVAEVIVHVEPYDPARDGPSIQHSQG
jgi:cation diffusion facilitator family transporter